MTFQYHIGLDEPAVYRIQLQGRVAERAMDDWFQGAYHQEVEPAQTGEVVTTFEGRIRDQAGLHGLLRCIRDLGLVLLSVECLSAQGERPAGG